MFRVLAKAPMRGQWLGFFVLAAGCASVVGVDFDQARQGDPQPTTPGADAQAPQPVGTTAPTVPASECAPGYKKCDSHCVKTTDPTYGCSAETCAPCSVPRASALTCVLGACAVATCDSGWADCNHDAKDGCEADLALKNTCGTCSMSCPMGAVCNQLVCAASCNAGLTNCSGACVDLAQSDSNCGVCGKGCMAPASGNGIGKCSAGKCGVQCNLGYHLCGDTCKPDNDANACGATCAVCPVPEHGRASCETGACGVVCAPQFEACATGCCPKTAVAMAGMAAGGNTTCAWDTRGEAYCWGAPDGGVLGIGPGALAQVAPAHITGLAGITGMTVGTTGRHACAWTGGGDLYCWGDGALGQAGAGIGASSDVPRKVAGITGVVGASAGGTHTCAWTSTGDLFCFGDGSKGALGTGAVSNEGAPRLVDVPSVRGAAAGLLSTCLFTASGAIACAGTNTDGRLGSGALPDAVQLVPTLLVAPTGVVGVIAGRDHVCAWKAAGDLSCWGAGGGGRIGGGGVASSSTPVAVALSIASVALGGAHSCAVTAGGEAYCWGRGAEGQLGIGRMGGMPGGGMPGGGMGAADTPQKITALTAVKGVAAGARHSCAWTATGEAYCWGATDQGQLGVGSLPVRDAIPTPRRVAAP